MPTVIVTAVCLCQLSSTCQIPGTSQQAKVLCPCETLMLGCMHVQGSSRGRGGSDRGRGGRKQVTTPRESQGKASDKRQASPCLCSPTPTSWNCCELSVCGKSPPWPAESVQVGTVDASLRRESLRRREACSSQRGGQHRRRAQPRARLWQCPSARLSEGAGLRPGEQDAGGEVAEPQ